MQDRVAVHEDNGIQYLARAHDTADNALIIEADFSWSGVTRIAAMIFPADNDRVRPDVDAEKPYAVLFGMGGPLPVYQNHKWDQRETVSDKVKEVAQAYHFRIGDLRAQQGYFCQFPGVSKTEEYIRDDATAALIADPEIERLLIEADADADYDPFDWTSVAHLDYELLAALQAWAEETDDADLKDLVTDDCGLREPETPTSGRTRLSEIGYEDAQAIVRELDRRWANGRPADLVTRVRERIPENALTEPAGMAP